VNVNQRLALQALQAQLPDHNIATAQSPLYRGVTCSCGWTFRVVRRQNRLAQGSKITAAIRAHYVAVLAKKRTPGH
jgi:hypothetical protein